MPLKVVKIAGGLVGSASMPTVGGAVTGVVSAAVT